MIYKDARKENIPISSEMKMPTNKKVVKAKLSKVDQKTSKVTSTSRQTTIEKFFGFVSTSTTKEEVNVVEVISNSHSSDVIDTAVAVGDATRPLPASLVAKPSGSAVKRKSRFETVEELEASYSVPLRRLSSPNVTAKLAPIFLRTKKEKVGEDSLVELSNQSVASTFATDVSSQFESILSDCYVTPVESLPLAPNCTAHRIESNSGVPFSHVVPGTSFVVDYFEKNNYSAVFLSHFHYDHYKNLSNSFTKKIYCSEDTARLVLQSFQKLGSRPEQQVIGLPLEQWSMVDGVPVLLLEAFHCPGAVCFLFRTQNKFCFHSGDFRAGLFVERYARALRSLHINTAFIDTTYCNPVYDFPSQSTIIRSVLEACTSGPNPIVSDKRCLVVVGTYTIGKECVFAALGRLLNTPICVASAKLRLIRCFLLPDKKNESYCNRLMSPCVLTTQPDRGARVHVLPMAKVNGKCLPAYLTQYQHLFDRLVAFSPTGWTTTACTPSNKSNSSSFSLNKRAISKQVTLYDVPYSEHSAFSELQRFVEECLSPPANIYSSVFKNYEDRRKIETQLRQWLKPGKNNSPS